MRHEFQRPVVERCGIRSGGSAAAGDPVGAVAGHAGRADRPPSARTRLSPRSSVHCSLRTAAPPMRRQSKRRCAGDRSGSDGDFRCGLRPRGASDRQLEPGRRCRSDGCGYRSVAAGDAQSSFRAGIYTDGDAHHVLAFSRSNELKDWTGANFRQGLGSAHSRVSAPPDGVGGLGAALDGSPGASR